MSSDDRPSVEALVRRLRAIRHLDPAAADALEAEIRRVYEMATKKI